MRKMICAMLAAMMILSVGIPAAFASHHGHHKRSVVPQVTVAVEETAEEYCHFTDENQDGICDNCENSCPVCESGKDNDCDGICDSCSEICHKCDGAKDTDGDGICDGCGMCPFETDHSGNGSCRCADSCRDAEENGHCSRTSLTYRHCARGSGHHH